MFDVMEIILEGFKPLQYHIRAFWLEYISWKSNNVIHKLC